MAKDQETLQEVVVGTPHRFLRSLPDHCVMSVSYSQPLFKIVDNSRLISPSVYMSQCQRLLKTPSTQHLSPSLA